MTLTVNPIGDNPQTPGLYAETYLPDQLIAGRFPLVTGNITLNAGTLQRGTVLGQQTIGAPTAAAGANTGNGTISAVTGLANAQIGLYKLTALSATSFAVVSPNGSRLADATVGTAYNDQIGFTITAGATAFAAGDTFNVTVAAGSGNYIQSVATAADGSQNPSAILADYADASGGPVTAPAYLTGEFNADKLVLDASWTVAALTPLLRAKSIFVKTFVSAADPT